MILPTKYIKLRGSLLNSGAFLLGKITDRQTVTQLWDKTKSSQEVKTFERFTLALDMLFLLGLIEIQDGIVKRLHHA